VLYGFKFRFQFVYCNSVILGDKSSSLNDFVTYSLTDIRNRNSISRNADSDEYKGYDKVLGVKMCDKITLVLTLLFCSASARKHTVTFKVSRSCQ
jgi:hypothetical protein